MISLTSDAEWPPSNADKPEMQQATSLAEEMKSME